MRIKFASQKGAAMVEFALILIPLLLITFGIIEFGMLMYNQQVITNASREGARAGIVASIPRVPNTGANSIDTVVQNYCSQHLVTFATTNPPPVTTFPSGASIPGGGGYSSTAAFGTNLGVLVTWDYSFLVIPNFIPGFTGLRHMNALTVMKYE
jgi:Flp pilus assembly protein TadG